MRKVEAPYIGPERRFKFMTRRMVDDGFLDVNAARGANNGDNNKKKGITIIISDDHIVGIETHRPKFKPGV